jgi:hypothetical protein
VEANPYGTHPVRHIHNALFRDELQHTAVRFAPRRFVAYLKQHRVVDVQRCCEQRRARTEAPSAQRHPVRNRGRELERHTRIQR